MKVSRICWHCKAYNFSQAETKAFHHMLELQKDLDPLTERIRLYAIELYKVDDDQWQQYFTIYYNIEKRTRTEHFTTSNTKQIHLSL